MFLDAGQVNKLKIAMQRNAGAEIAVTFKQNTDTSTLTGLVSTFGNANGVTFGSAGNVITASVNTNYQPPGAYLTTAMASNAGSDFVQAGAVFFGTNASGTIASNAISVSVAPPGAGGSILFSAGTLSSFRSDITFENSNGVTFGLETNGIITATVATNYQSSGAYLTTAALSQDSSKYAGTNGSIFGGSITVNTSGVTVSLPAYLTTAMASNRGSDFVQATAAFAGTNASGTIASNGISVSVAAPTAGVVKFSAGTLSSNRTDITFGDLNGVSFGLETNGVITASIDAAATGLTNIKVSAGTLSALRSDITFNNGGGVTFGLETNGIITATVSTNYQSQGAYLTTAALSQDSSKYAGTSTGIAGGSVTLNTSGISISLPAYLTTAMASNRGSDFVQATAVFAGTNASGTIASGGISISVADPSTGGGLTNVKFSAGTLSSLRSDVTFSNSNGVSWGLNTNGVITASINTTIISVASQGMFWNMDHAVPNTDFYVQDFDAGTEPAGWVDFNANAAVWNHSPGLDGPFCLELPHLGAGGYGSIYTFDDPQDEVFISFLFQHNGVLPPDITEIMDLYDEAFNEIMQLYLHDTGKLRLKLHNAYDTSVIPVNTTIRIWCHYKRHESGRTLASIAWSEGADIDVEPLTGPNYASGNDGDFDTPVLRILFGPTSEVGQTFLYDDLHVAKQNYMNYMKVSAGTSIGSLTDVTFSNLNGVSFGLNSNNVITASVVTNYQSAGAYLTTAMASNRGSDFVQATAAFAGTNASGTIASNGISVSVAAPSAATVSLWPDYILFPDVTTVSTYYSGSKSQGGGGGSTSSGYTFSIYMVPIVFPTAVAFSNLRMVMSNITSGGTGSATHVYSAGFYTNNANTLSLVKGYYGGIVLSQNSSTAWTYSVWTASTAGATSDAAGYAGISKASIQSSQGNVNSSLQINGSSKLIRIDNGVMTTLTAGQYWFAYANAWATSGVNALSLAGVAQAPAVTQLSTGFLDAGVNTSASAPMYGSGWGVISTTYASVSNAANFWALPNAIAFTNMSVSSTSVQRNHFPFLRGI